MTVKQIVKKYLQDEGYDGLCHPREECSCILGILMPCNAQWREECVAGHETENGIAPGRKEGVPDGSKCRWTYDSQHDEWDAGCGAGYGGWDGNLADDGFLYCPSCGLRIEEVRDGE